MYAEIIKSIGLDCFDIVLSYHNPLRIAPNTVDISTNKTADRKISLYERQNTDRDDLYQDPHPYHKSPVYVDDVCSYMNEHKKIKKSIENGANIEKYIMEINEIRDSKLSFEQLKTMSSIRFGVLIYSIRKLPNYTLGEYPYGSFGDCCECRSFNEFYYYSENMMEIRAYLCSLSKHISSDDDLLDEFMIGRKTKKEFVIYYINKKFGHTDCLADIEELIPHINIDSYHDEILIKKNIGKYKDMYFNTPDTPGYEYIIGRYHTDLSETDDCTSRTPCTELMRID
jgi:hypothetical protein